MIPYLPPTERVRIDRVLESAVVLSWKELLRSSHRGMVHVEYATAPEPSLQYLKIWLSTTRGTWDLICEYWMHSAPSSIPAAGLTFSNGYYSAALAQMLEHMMRHQEGVPNSLAGKTGVNLIQVQPPTEDERRKAGDCMNEAYQRIGLAFVQAASGTA
jgi:hypothetical protein